jgi:DNA-binding XRE family transcriptional regulator
MSHNHLRRYRKRGALTQSEIAFLLGVACGTNVSRHERASRPPSLQTALAYQAVFGVPVHELFPQDYRSAVAAVQARADQLSRHVVRRPDGGKALFKQKLLATIGAGPSVSPNQHHERTSK